MPKEIPQYLLASRIEAENRVGVGPEIWTVCESGGLHRSPELKRRRMAVYVEMRAMGHSYTEIAEACGVSHSSVIALVHEHERRTGTPVKPWSRPPRGIQPPPLDARQDLTEKEFFEGVRDAWRRYSVFRDQDSLMDLFGLLDDDAARHDPHYQPIRQRRSA